MDAHGADDLRRRLDAGQPIEGWCYTCDERWVLSEKERAGIARGLAA